MYTRRRIGRWEGGIYTDQRQSYNYNTAQYVKAECREQSMEYIHNKNSRIEMSMRGKENGRNGRRKPGKDKFRG